MKFGLFAASLTCCTLIAPFQGQRLSTREVQNVTHCIKAGDRDWLDAPLSDAKSFYVGLTHDRRSYPGEDHIIAVVFQSRTAGQFFDITATCNDKCVYTIQNNGAFKLQKKAIKLVGAPLGGIWTEEYLEKNIKKTFVGPKVRVQISDIIHINPEVICKSYAQTSPLK
jgi:hypothetical protein